MKTYKVIDTVQVEYVEDEHNAERDFTASFWYWNRRYYLDDFIRVHDNPWIYDDFPEDVHGMEADNYVDPLFIGVDAAGETVVLYKEVDP